MEPYVKLFQDLKANGVQGLPNTIEEFKNGMLTNDKALFSTLAAANKLGLNDRSYSVENKALLYEQLGLVKKKVESNGTGTSSAESKSTSSSPNYGEMRQKTEQEQKVKDEQALTAQKLSADLWARKPESKKIIESAKVNKSLTPVPDYATKPAEYSGADAALNVLPPAVKTNLLKDKELGQEVMDYLRDNPQEAQKLQFQGKVSVSQGQFTDVNLDTWNNLQSVLSGVANKYTNKIGELTQQGVPQLYEKLVKDSGDYDKLADQYKKSTTVINFYQNQYLKDKGLGDLVEQNKALKKQIDSFVAPKTEEEQAAQNEVIQKYNQGIQKQNELAQGLDKIPEYKNALEQAKSLQGQLEQLGGQLQEYSQYKPVFDEYLAASSKLNNIQNKLNLYKTQFAGVKEREVQQEAWNNFVKESPMGIGKAADLGASIINGFNGSLAKVAGGIASLGANADDKEYSVFDQASDLLNDAQKKVGFVTTDRTPVAKDGKIDWYGVVKGGADNVGTMAIAALTGMNPAKNLFATEIAASNLSNLTSLGRMAAVANENAPMVTTFYLMSVKDRLNEASAAGLKGNEAQLYAHTLAWLEGFSELIMPDAKLVTGTIKKELVQDAVKGVTKGVGWYKTRAIGELLKNMGKEAAEEFVVKGGEYLSQTMANELSGAKFDTSGHDITTEKGRNEWITTGIVAAGLAGVASTPSTLSNPSQQQKSDLYQAANNPTEARGILDEMVNKGKLTSDQAETAYKQIIRYAAVKGMIPSDISPDKAVELVPIIEENEHIKMLLPEANEIFKPRLQEALKQNIEKAQEILSREEAKKPQETTTATLYTEQGKQYIAENISALEKDIAYEQEWEDNRAKDKKGLINKIFGRPKNKYLEEQKERLQTLKTNPLAYFKEELKREEDWEKKHPDDSNPDTIKYLKEAITELEQSNGNETGGNAEPTTIGVVEQPETKEEEQPINMGNLPVPLQAELTQLGYPEDHEFKSTKEALNIAFGTKEAFKPTEEVAPEAQPPAVEKTGVGSETGVSQENVPDRIPAGEEAKVEVTPTLIEQQNEIINSQKIQGKLFTEKEAEDYQKEIDSNYEDGQPKFNAKGNDIRQSAFSLDQPIAEKEVNGIELKITQGLNEGSGNDSKKTYLLYANGKVVGKFYSVPDVKKVVKLIEDNLIKPLLPAEPVITEGEKLKQEEGSVGVGGDVKKEGENKDGSIYKSTTKEKDGLVITNYDAYRKEDGKKYSLGGRKLTRDEFLSEYEVEGEFLDMLDGAEQIIIREVRNNKGNLGISAKVRYEEGWIDIDLAAVEQSLKETTKAETPKPQIQKPIIAENAESANKEETKNNEQEKDESGTGSAKKQKEVPVKEVKARKKPTIKNPLAKKVLNLEIPKSDPIGRVMQYFIGGGKINRADVKKFHKNSEAEVRSKIQIVRTDAPTITQLAHQLWEDDTEQNTTDQDYRNAIEDVLLSHNSPSSMIKSMTDKYFPEVSEEEMEQSGIEVEAEDIAEDLISSLSDTEAEELLAMLKETYGEDLEGLEEAWSTGGPIVPFAEKPFNDIWEKFGDEKAKEIEERINQFIYEQRETRVKGQTQTSPSKREKETPVKKEKPKAKQESGAGKDVDDILDDLAGLLSEPESDYPFLSEPQRVVPKQETISGLQGISDTRKEFQAEKKEKEKELLDLRKEIDDKKNDFAKRGVKNSDREKVLRPMLNQLEKLGKDYQDFITRGEKNVSVSNATQQDLFSPPLNNTANTNIGQIQFESLTPDEKIEGYEKNPEPDAVVFMERKMGEKGGVEFITGSTEIKGASDIAYLFRHLETNPTENVFGVAQFPDGSAKNLYLGSGGTASAVVDVKLLLAFAKDMKDEGATSITLVHNHPTGNLTPSAADRQIHKQLRTGAYAIGVILNDSVIIDHDSGTYSTFNESESSEFERPKQVKGEVPHKVYEFNRQELYVPSSEKTTISRSLDVAIFMSKQKRGLVGKMGMLVLDSKRNINKYLFFDETITDKELLASAIYEIGKHGEAIVLVSNKKIPQDTITFLSGKLRDIVKGDALMDVVVVNPDPTIIDAYTSYLDEGILREEEVPYSSIQHFAQKYNMNNSGYFPNNVWLEAARKDLRKISDRFGIKQAKSGGYFLTLNGKKYNPFESKGNVLNEPNVPNIPLETIAKAQDILSKLYAKGIKEFPQIVEILTKRFGEEVINQPIGETGATLIDGLKAAYGMMGAFYDDLTPMKEVRNYNAKRNDINTDTSTEPVSTVQPENTMGAEDVQPVQGRIRQGNNPTIPETTTEDERPVGESEPTSGIPVDERDGGDTGVRRGQPRIRRNVPGRTDKGGGSLFDETGEQPQPKPREGSDEFTNRDGTESQHAIKLALQNEAENIPAVPGDIKNIADTLPFLMDSQIEDIHKAEKRLVVDGEKAIMFANGTGTGKGLMALGIVKRFMKEGKNNIVIVVPKQELIDKAMEEAKFLNIPLRPLTSTQDGGVGVTITTYANLRMNTKLQMRVPDLVIYDESQNILENQEGDIGSTTQSARRLFSYGPYDQGIRKAAEVALGIAPDYAMYNYDTPLDIAATNRDPRDKWNAAYDARKEEFKEAAKTNYNKTKVVLLSATPFSGEKALVYTDGLLNDLGDLNNFYIQNFGYRIRYSKLTQPEKDVDRNLMQVTFTDRQIKEGKQSVRMLDVPFDYSRDFLTLESAAGNLIDEGLRILQDEYKLGELVRKAHGGNYYTKLLEQAKAKLIIPVVKNLVERGFKVVVFHDFNKNEGVEHPFKMLYPFARDEKEKKQLQAFYQDYPHFQDIPLTDLAGVIQTFEKEMPNDTVFLNGQNATLNAVKLFNDDTSGKDVIVVNSAKGNAGFSMHDTTGNKPRVLINIGLPVRPIYALQTEGRIYRVGQASNAAFIYPIIGTSFEQYKFSKIGERTGATENLALGSIARNLKDIYIQGYQQAISDINFDELGTGSKESDRGKMQIDTWELAKSLYYGQQKRNASNKAQEGADYYATPEPVGLKMVELLDLKPGEKFMEPSAGHGAIARWIPETINSTAIEPSYMLRSKLQLNAPQLKRVEGYDFMTFPIINKFKGIAMNPPFGTAGKTAIEHVGKAFDHLQNGGRVIAIIPNGEGLKKFGKWMEEHQDKAVLRMEVRLPQVMFKRAGTQVSTSLMVVDRVEGALEYPMLPQAISIDLSGIEDINDLFNEVKELPIPHKIVTPSMAEQQERVENAYGELPKFEKKERAGKDGKTYFLAKPSDKIGDKFKAVAMKANENSGWWSKFSRSFEFRTELDRESFINGIDSMYDQVLEEEPGSYQYYNKKADDAAKDLHQEIRNSMSDMSANPFGSAIVIAGKAMKFLAYKLAAGVSSLAQALAGTGFVKNKFWESMWKKAKEKVTGWYRQPGIPTRSILSQYPIGATQMPEFRTAINRVFDGQQHKTDIDFLLSKEIDEYNDLIAMAIGSHVVPALTDIRDALVVMQTNIQGMNADMAIKYADTVRESKIDRPVLYDYNPNAFVRFMYEMIDTLYPQKKVQDQIKKSGGLIKRGNDPYTLSEIYEGKLVAKQLEFNERVVKSRRTITGGISTPSLLERMIADGIDLGLQPYEGTTSFERFLERMTREVSGAAYLKFLTDQQPKPTFPEYLHAIHAKERNEYVKNKREEAIQEELTRLNAEYVATQSPDVFDEIQQILAGKHPDFQPMEDMGSGMSNADADAVINELINNYPEDLQKYEKYRAEFVEEVVNPIKNLLIDSELVSQDTMDEWDQNLPNWVHLPVDYYSDENFVQGGSTIKGRTPIKAIKGSYKQRVNPLFATIEYYNKVLKSAEMNTIKKELYNLVRQYPNEDLWRVTRPQVLTVFDPLTGQYVTKSKATMPNNAIPVMRNGKTWWIEIKDKGLLDAWNSFGVKQGKGFVEKMMSVMHPLMYTTAIMLNPDFMVSNAIRDIETALINVGSELDAKGVKRNIAKYWLPSMRAVFRAQRNRPAASEVEKFAYEFQEDGGLMSWGDMISGTLEDKVKKINDELLDAERYIGTPRYQQAITNILPYLWDLFGDAQTSVENASRLATYIAARKAGEDRIKSAAIAKNITVNFNKKGAKSNFFNSFWWLFNAASQSGYRSLSGLARSKRVKVAAGLLYGASVGLGFWNMSANPDMYMSLPERQKATGFVFMDRDGGMTYRRLPATYFWNIFKYAGDVTAQVFSGHMSKSEAAKHMFIEGIASVNPLGYSDDEKQFFENFTPTVARLPMQVFGNETWYSAPIHPENKFGFENKKSELYWDETAEWAKELTAWLSEASGAPNKKNEGLIEISPADVEYVAKSYFSGPYRTMYGVSQLIKDIKSGDYHFDKYPVSRVFFGKIPSQKVKSEMMEMIDKGEHNPINQRDIQRFSFLVQKRAIQIAVNLKNDPRQAAKEMRSLKVMTNKYFKLKALDMLSEVLRDKTLTELNDLISSK